MASNTTMPSPEATATAADAARKIAENEWFVLGAYFLAFGIWSAAAGNDFISPTWKTVRATRPRGKLHVAFSFVPMIYISVYISYQIKSGNSQEMGAALLALAFAVLHLARTFMGLWQLHVFKLWTKSCIKSMESLGYTTSSPATVACDAEYSDSDDNGNDSSSEAEEGEEQKRRERNGESIKSEVDNDDSVSHIDPHGCCPVLTSLFRRSRSPTILGSERDRIERIADSILVNDTLIDNRLSDVHTVCSFRLLSTEQEKTVRKSISLLRRVRMRLQYGFLNAFCTLRVLLSLACLKAPLFPNPESGPRLVPRRPESVWLNWATALVAQVGWMQDDNAHRNPDPSAGYTEHRNHFAEQILLSAAFHTRRTAPLEDGTDRSHSARVSSGFLVFQDWRNYPKLCSGQFSKQEFLKRACKTGFGLPYRVPHPRAVQTKEGSKQYGYGHFASELLRAREALPPEIETRVTGFDVGELEWFSIFVSVENWAPLSSSSENPASTRGFSDNSPIDPKSENDSREGIQSEDVSKDNDTPVENLKQQLGFVKQSNFVLEQSKLPLLRGISTVNLWGNRNVLEISCHIDNWMALCAADQAAYMMKHIPWMEEQLNCKNLSSRESQGGNMDSDTDEASMEKIVRQSVDFEKYRFMCQMTVVQPEYFHLENSLSFLGCSMEMLRSSLAKWAEAHEGCDEGSWKPTIFSNEDVHESSQCRDLGTFEGTPDFTSCLRSLKCVQDMSKRFVKMRILWELQNHLQKHLPETGVAPRSAEAMALCILSFPAVSIEVRGAIRKSTVSFLGEQIQESVVDVEHGHMAPFEVHNYEYVISASHGPEDIQLVLSVQALEAKPNALISLRLCSMEESAVTLFDWEVWRDAFFGRLEACRQWKEKVCIPSFSLIPSTQRITSGMQKVVGSTAANIPQSRPGSKMSVWNGWLPHYASICLYEISTEKLLLQPRKVERLSLRFNIGEGEGSFFNIPEEIWLPVTYAEASATSLKIASLMAQDLLKNASSRRQEEEQPPLERAERLLSQNSDADASLALRLIESVAIMEKDTAALEKAMRIVLRDVKKAEAVVRGADLLERFYVHETRGRGHIPSFFRNDSYVRAVASLFEELAKASGYDIYVALKYQFFLMHLELYRGKTAFPSAAHFMFQTVVYGCYSRNIAESDESVLWSCFPLQSCKQFEEFAVLFLGYSNVAEKVDHRLKRRMSERHVILLDDVRYTANIRLGAAIQTVAGKVGGTRALELLSLSPHRTVDLYEQSIQERGYANAMCKLGHLFEKGGHEIERNIPRAESLYRRAVEQNDTVAMSLLARLLYSGEEGVEQNIPEAVTLLHRAVDEYGDASAMNLLAYMLRRGENGIEKDIPGAIELYARAIEERNDTSAMISLARVLYEGEEGADQDVPQALELLHRAVRGGDVDAMSALAALFHYGHHGVEKDATHAVTLYSRAIQEGNDTTAMCSLARLLLTGEEGVEQDVSRAVDLLYQAIQGGNVDAMNALAILLCEGNHGVEKDVPRAVTLLSRAIEEGSDTTAMCNLAVLLLTGEEGVEQDVSRAVDLLHRAAREGGDMDAIRILQMYSES